MHRPLIAKLVVALALFRLMSASAGYAQSDEPAKAGAQAILREGNALLKQKHPAEALTKFTEAYRLFASPKLHYNIGQAHSQLPGHEAQAYDELSRFLAEAKDASPELRAAAEMQLRQLRAKVGLITVAAETAGADLLVDGAPVGKTPRPTPVVLGVGTHRLMLKKDSIASRTATVTIVGSDERTVSLALPTTAPSPPRESPTPPPLTSLQPTPPPAAPPQGAVLTPAASQSRDELADEDPIYRKTWFWVGAAAVVAAGAVTAVVLARAPKDPTATLGSRTVN